MNEAPREGQLVVSEYRVDQARPLAMNRPAFLNPYVVGSVNWSVAATRVSIVYFPGIGVRRVPWCELEDAGIAIGELSRKSESWERRNGQNVPGAA